jgi:hypothetical protein
MLKDFPSEGYSKRTVKLRRISFRRKDHDEDFEVSWDAKSRRRIMGLAEFKDATT